MANGPVAREDLELVWALQGAGSKAFRDVRNKLEAPTEKGRLSSHPVEVVLSEAQSSSRKLNIKELLIKSSKLLPTHQLVPFPVSGKTDNSALWAWDQVSPQRSI